MQKISFLLMMLCISVYAYAKKAPPAKVQPSTQVLSITKMQPYQTAPEDVTTLGEPFKKEENKETSLWRYKIGTTQINLYWDNKLKRLKNYEYISTLFPNVDWPQQGACKLETGITTLADAINLLGDPKDMIVNLDYQQLHYEFNNNVVLLFFYKNKLQQLQLHAKGTKKVG